MSLSCTGNGPQRQMRPSSTESLTIEIPPARKPDRKHFDSRSAYYRAMRQWTDERCRPYREGLTPPLYCHVPRQFATRLAAAIAKAKAVTNEAAKRAMLDAVPTSTRSLAAIDNSDRPILKLPAAFRAFGVQGVLDHFGMDPDTSAFICEPYGAPSLEEIVRLKLFAEVLECRLELTPRSYWRPPETFRVAFIAREDAA